MFNVFSFIVSVCSFLHLSSLDGHQQLIVILSLLHWLKLICVCIKFISNYRYQRWVIRHAHFHCVFSDFSVYVDILWTIRPFHCRGLMWCDLVCLWIIIIIVIVMWCDRCRWQEELKQRKHWTQPGWKILFNLSTREASKWRTHFVRGFIRLNKIHFFYLIISLSAIRSC